MFVANLCKSATQCELSVYTVLTVLVSSTGKNCNSSSVKFLTRKHLVRVDRKWIMSSSETDSDCDVST